MTNRISAFVLLVFAGAANAAEPSALELTQTIDLKGKAGKLDHLALDAKRDRLFLANTANGTLDVIDLKAGKMLKQILGQSGIQGVTFAADLDRVFVGLGAGGYCNVFDGVDYKLLKTTKFGASADNVKYDPMRGLAFVAHAEKSLGVLDAKSLAVKGDIVLPGDAEGFQTVSGKPQMFVVLPSPSQLVVIDPDKKEIVGNRPISVAGGGHTIALDDVNKRIFVGCRKSSVMLVMDIETGREITFVGIPLENDDLFFDAKRKRLYASCGEGFIAVIKQLDADRYEIMEQIPTARGSKTSLFDPESSRLFLAVPRQEGKASPEIRVYRVRD